MGGYEMIPAEIRRIRRFARFFSDWMEREERWCFQSGIPFPREEVQDPKRREMGADRKAEKSLEKVSEQARRDILSSMAVILSHIGVVDVKDLEIRPYRPGELGIISSRHCVLYREEYGFDGTFENYLLEGMSRFLWECGGKGQVWVVDYWGCVMGAIAIVETGEAEGQLRWFYLEPSCRGMGMGRRLMETALSYCEERNLEKVFLWTVRDLEQARRLYENFGFSLVTVHEHFLWGRQIVEEKWERQLKRKGGSR
jgi:GNAT superfamily N-acetyltransferase